MLRKNVNLLLVVLVLAILSVVRASVASAAETHQLRRQERQQQPKQQLKQQLKQQRKLESSDVEVDVDVEQPEAQMDRDISASDAFLCSICMAEFVPGAEQQLDPEVYRWHADEQHAPTFHKKCIEEWLKHKLECPNCRLPVQGPASATASSGNPVLPIDHALTSARPYTQPMPFPIQSTRTFCCKIVCGVSAVYGVGLTLNYFFNE